MNADSQTKRNEMNADTHEMNAGTHDSRES
jgi:hypothetical protein